MKRRDWVIGVMVVCCGVLEGGNQKLAQTGCQFLSVVSDARGSGMGEAMTSVSWGSGSLFFNPAGMAEMVRGFEVSGSVNAWIADIRHSTLGMVFGLGEWGVLGASVQYVDYGSFLGTRVDKMTELGYEDTGEFGLTSLAVGLGYARLLTDRFGVGGQVRYVRQDLGESVVPRFVVVGEGSQTRQDTVAERVRNRKEPLAFDFGTRFKTGIKSLVFGMSVRNFSKEIKYVEEGFQLPLVFNLGISMDVMDFWAGQGEVHRMLVSVDASHHRDHPEQIKVGVEYGLRGVLYLRWGYMSGNDESGMTFGLGLRWHGIGVDYAYTPYGVFDHVQRMTVRVGL